MPSTHDIGTKAEDIAEAYLREQGWTILGRNWSYKKLGELDIIGMDAEMVVFVEVRYRRSVNYGLPEGSLSPAKIRHIRNTALMWLVVHGKTDAPCRFDVIGMDMMGGDVAIRHVRNAL